jgi:hypothetical protein
VLHPLDHGDLHAREKRVAGAEIPGFVRCADTEDAEILLFGEGGVPLGREVQEGIREAFEVASPARQFAGVLDDILDACAFAVGDQTQLSFAFRFKGLVDSPQRQCLIRDPVQGVDGDDDVELALEGEMAGIGDSELKIGAIGGPVLFRESDHVGYFAFQPLLKCHNSFQSSAIPGDHRTLDSHRSLLNSESCCELFLSTHATAINLVSNQR